MARSLALTALGVTAPGRFRPCHKRALTQVRRFGGTLLLRPGWSVASGLGQVRPSAAITASPTLQSSALLARWPVYTVATVPRRTKKALALYGPPVRVLAFTAGLSTIKRLPQRGNALAVTLAALAAVGLRVGLATPLAAKRLAVVALPFVVALVLVALALVGFVFAIVYLVPLALRPVVCRCKICGVVARLFCAAKAIAKVRRCNLRIARTVRAIVGGFCVALRCITLRQTRNMPIG